MGSDRSSSSLMIMASNACDHDWSPMTYVTVASNTPESRWMT